MQRKAIRATVGAADVDIPIHTFLPNQFVYYDASGTGALTTIEAVRPVGTPTAGNLAEWFNANSIVDSGVSLADVVTTTETPAAGQVAVFTGVGKAIEDGGVLVTDVVRGPAVSADGDVAIFDGSTGKVIKDTGLISTNIITTAASAPSANTVPVFSGTGKNTNPSTVTIIGGDIAGVATINTIDPATWVVGPAGAISNNLASYDGSTGRVIKDSGITATTIVTATGAPANHHVATWTGTGNALQVETVTITGGAITSVTTINGTDPATWVVGPASAVNNSLASYNGTSGKVIKDSGVTATDVVTIPGVSVPSGHQVATWTGSGKTLQGEGVVINGTTISNVTLLDGKSPGDVLSFNQPVNSNSLAVWGNTLGFVIKDSVVIIDNSGNLTGVGLINGVNIGVHATRHLVDGSDSIFYPNSTFAWFNGDLASYTGSGLPFAPRRFKAYVAPSQTVTSSLSSVIAFSTGALGSAGDYFVEYNIMITTDGSAGTFSVRVIWTGGTGVAVGTVDPGITGTLQTSSGSAANATIPSGTAAFVVRVKLGLTGAAATDAISFAIAWSGATAATLVANGTAFFTRAN